jgi:hypothetical protein
LTFLPDSMLMSLVALKFKSASEWMLMLSLA